MAEKGCPFKESCPVAGSLSGINIPLIAGYCSDNYEQCRYYRRRLVRAGKETVGVGA